MSTVKATNMKKQSTVKASKAFTSGAANVAIDKSHFAELGCIDEILKCPVYRPSKIEFEDPLTYLHNIAPEASKYGICKIIAPIDASVPASVVLTKELRNFKFETAVQPFRLAQWDVKDKISFYRRGRQYSYHEFEKMANKESACQVPCSSCDSPAYMEKEFWHRLICGKKETVEYGVNVDGSAFSCDPSDQLGKSKWNLKTKKKLTFEFCHGFNCGEAVNFATADWFPMGELASQRYALLKKIPIISYEELLCNEAMLLLMSSKQDNPGNSSTDVVSQRAVKISFVRLIRQHKQALHRIKASSASSPHAQGTLLCGLCKGDCYLAYNMCNFCNSDPLCLFHEIDLLYRSCGHEPTIFLRPDITAMEDAATKFELQEELSLELQY